MLWSLRARLVHLLNALRRRKTDHEIEDEIDFHLEMRVRENIEAGMSPEEARQAAYRRFGSILRVKEASREIRYGASIDALARDLRFSVRLLSKQPRFAFVVTVTIALGIGANTAIFSVVNAVLVKPLPYERSSELALIWSTFEKMGASRAPASGTELREIRDRSQLLADVAGIWVGNGTLTGDPEPEQVKLASVTNNFFSVLGARPLLGRTFLPEEHGAGPRELLISYALWKRRFGEDRDIVGRAVRLNGGSFTIVGVMPQDFLLAFPPDANVPMDIPAWVPFQDNIYQGPRDLYYIRLLARLKPGVTLEQAQEEATSISRQLREGYTEYNSENLHLTIAPLHADVIRDVRRPILLLFVGAGLVLVISCFNVANLLLARASVRRKEIAVRVALGASRWRVSRQLLCESLLICLIGGTMGLGVGWLGLKLLLRIRPETLRSLGAINLDVAVLAFVAVITLGATIATGLAPAIESGKTDLVETLKDVGRTPAGRIKDRTRTILIVSEIALGFVLLVGSGLMIRTLIQLHRVSPGFNSTNLLTFEISLPGGPGAQRNAFVTEWEKRLSVLPGVESLGAISHLPLDDYPNWYSPYAPEGVDEQQKNHLLADYRAVTPGYFTAMGASLIDGRYFNDLDTPSTRKVVIIDKMLAETTWPNESPIGKRLNVEHFTDRGFTSDWAEVVGVVGHIKGQSLLRQLRGQIYIPYPQSAREHLSFVVRTTVNPLSLAGTVRTELSRLDKTRAIAKIRPMDDYVARAMAPTNFTVALGGIFAALALLLATVGIYSVVSYSVSLRKHEISIRMALGARPADIVRMIVKEGMILTAFGLVLGLGGALFLSEYLREMLFEVAPFDALTYIVMALLIPAAALIACWKPARKASSENPVEALRN
jgi:putative ABC transport system permease protein